MARRADDGRTAAPAPHRRDCACSKPCSRASSAPSRSWSAIRISCPSSSASDTRVVAVSTHNPLGTTFAAGVYASIFGSSREPVNALYARRMFDDDSRPAGSDTRFAVILGGSGAWQIEETGTEAEFGIDTVVSGRAESRDVIELFRRALAGETLPRRSTRTIRTTPAQLVVPETRTSFGVVEMTTGCGRRCAFCQPDLNPRISVPKATRS